MRDSANWLYERAMAYADEGDFVTAKKFRRALDRLAKEVAAEWKSRGIYNPKWLPPECRLALLLRLKLGTVEHQGARELRFRQAEQLKWQALMAKQRELLKQRQLLPRAEPRPGGSSVSYQAWEPWLREPSLVTSYSSSGLPPLVRIGVSSLALPDVANRICPCGSGKLFSFCHGKEPE